MPSRDSPPDAVKDVVLASVLDDAKAPCAMLALVVTCTTGMGCYAHGGRALELDPNELLVEARRACQRGDPGAYRTLLKRLIRVYPDASQAAFARDALEQKGECGGEPEPIR